MPGCLEPSCQRAAADKLQHEERLVVVSAVLEQLNDVRILDRGDYLGLNQETGLSHRVGVLAAKDHLDRHRPIQGGLPGAVDHTHPTTAELPLDLIVRDGRENRTGLSTLRHPSPLMGAGSLPPDGIRVG